MEEELIRAARAGDKDAYASLVGLHASAVLGFCVSIVGNAHDADDAAQETFIKGFAQLPGLRADNLFRPWILRIARNQCIDLLRRHKRGQRAIAEAAMERAMPGARTQESPENAKRESLHEAITRLPEKYRVPLMLYYLEEQCTERVAKALDIDPATVATRLSRARKLLRRMLHDQEDAR